MKRAGFYLMAAAGLLAGVSAQAQHGPGLAVKMDKAVAASAADSPVADDTPYGSIVARNMFGLVPMPPPDDPANQPPVDPPPKITPTGIMTIFGRDQALFRAADKGKPGQQAKENSYVLAEGERQDDIEVVKINHLDGIITFNNHGIEQELPLVPSKDSGSSGGSGGGPSVGSAAGPGGRSGGMMSPGERAAFRRPAMPSVVNPNNGAAGMGSAMGGTAPANSTGVTMSGGTTVNERGIYQPVEDPNLTPEQSVILIEAQRMKYMQDKNPIANMLPPTPLTEQNK